MLLEYLAHGLPVVATDIPSNREVIEPGVNGLLVGVRRPDELAEAILSVLDDDALSARLTSAARPSVERFTWDATADGFRGAYAGLVPSSAPGT